MQCRAVVSHETLDRMQWHADPLTDDLVADLVGDWGRLDGCAEGGDAIHADRFLTAANADSLRALIEVAAAWRGNAEVCAWCPPAALSDPVAARVRLYLQAASQAPVWLDKSKLARAERIFAEHGAMTMAVLSCASLPETYVLPDLAAVLRITGQLEKHTEYRIRATGTTLFPLMERGGLDAPDGGAVAQLLKTRLTHAAIRHLILRGNPAAAAAQAIKEGLPQRAATIPALAPASASAPAPDLHHAELATAGWALGEETLPCNQEEMAYTLLTFGYVYLRSLRKLGLRLSREDEEAYLHLWNVAGHYLGIEHALLVPDMEQAATLFAAMQARGRSHQTRKYLGRVDPRPALGAALMGAFERAMQPSFLRVVPAMTARYLCGRESSADLALDRGGARALYPLFLVAMAILRGLDRAGASLRPGFSLTRFLCRLMGYRFMLRLVAFDQAPARSPPPASRQQFLTAISAWSRDPHAGAWLNALERRLRGANAVD